MTERIANRLAEARRERGWTQSELARQSGVGRAHITRIEGGHLPGVTADTVRKLAQALGITSDWLLGLK